MNIQAVSDQLPKNQNCIQIRFGNDDLSCLNQVWCLIQDWQLSDTVLTMYSSVMESWYHKNHGIIRTNISGSHFS